MNGRDACERDVFGRSGSVRFPQHRIAASSLLILFGIALGLIIAELAVRLLGLGKPEFYTYSATRGWKLLAGATGWQTDEGRAFVRLNRWGYRGSDWTRVKPSGTLRIAVLGDSFIEAQQVAEQDTVCELIQRDLTQSLPTLARGRYQGLKRVEVMNFGVDGYGTAQEFFTLIEDVWQFSPDIVVLAFFPGNDVRNNSAVLEGDKCRPFFVPHGNEVVLGGPFEDSRLFRFQCFLRFASYSSQLLNVLGEARSTLRSMQRQHRQRADPQPASRQSAGVPMKLNVLGEAGSALRIMQQQHRQQADARPALRQSAGVPVNPTGVPMSRLQEPGINDLIYRPPINQYWHDAWQVSEAEIEMTEQNVRAHHALFLLVIVGTGVQMEPNPAFQAGYLRAVGGTDLLYPNHRLVALGARQGFPVLDLVPPMKIYAQDHQVYFHGFPNTAMGTGHWNQRGNRFAAGLIANKLAEIMAQSQDR